MKEITPFLFFVFSIILYGQNNYNTDNFDVTIEDLKTKYNGNSNALVVFETGESETIKADRSIRFIFKQKLKILTKDGLDKANITIPLYNNNNKKETINNITATTYNLDGKKISKTSINPNNVLYNKITNKLTLVQILPPNVKEGSVITYSYTLDSPFIQKFREWDFQDDIPKLYSQYTTYTFTDFNTYRVRLIGILNLDKNEEEHCVKNGLNDTNCIKKTYSMKNIPAFIEEDFMSNKSNYLSRIDYEPYAIKAPHNYLSYTAPSWLEVDNSFMSIIKSSEKIYNKELFKTLLPKKIKTETNVLKKVELIHKYVQENYSLSTQSEKEDRFIIKNLIKNKTGSAFEINLLLFNLLKNNGIHVKPALLSTRENGLIYKGFPIISSFNYFIVHAEIDNKIYYLDSTNKYLSFGQIPFKCLNQNARIIDDVESKWISINPEKTSVKNIKIELNLKTSNTLTGSITAKNTGYFGLLMKKEFYSDSTSYYKKFENEHQNLFIKKKRTIKNDKASNAFIQEFDINLDLENINDNVYIKPFFFEPITVNPFKASVRSYPIDFGYKTSITHIIKLTIDSKYSVVNLPKNVTMQLPDKKGTLILNTTKNKNELIVYFKFNLKEAVYQPHEYEYLKAFYSTIVDIQKNTLIVLKKKS